MLNELFQVAEALENLGVAGKEAHPNMKPMGKSPVLITRMSVVGKIASVDLLLPEQSALLKRIEHGAAGTSFPGFNLPSPVWDLGEVPNDMIKQFVEVQKDRKATAKQRLAILRGLAGTAKLRSFTVEQKRQFNRIFQEFVPLLASDFPQATPGIEAFVHLLELLGKHPPVMSEFVSEVIGHLTRAAADIELSAIKTVEGFLVGKVVFRGVEAVGSSEWWQRKKKEDKKNAKTAVFLDLDSPPPSAAAVAHQGTCENIESHLLKVRPGRGYAKGGKGADARTGVDAFTGEIGELTTSFPEPRVQVLRPPDLKLFSASSETKCLTRYGMIESAIFPVAKTQSARMQNAILKLASKKEQRGKTWFPIPSNLNEGKKPKADLLVAYLEGEPEGRAQLAEMFGGEANTFSDADFEAIAQPVLEMLEGKVAANANLKVRLLAFCPIDKGKKQISLNRSLRVQDVIRAARDWEAGARNVPDVSIWFHDKHTKQPVFLTHYCPSPLELPSTINLVWSSKADGEFISKYQRTFSVADAYDVFVTDSPLAKQKAQSALALLVDRMSILLATVASTKNKWEWIKKNKPTLSDTVRWQSLKATALIGILLHQLGHYKKDFMQEPITQIGRLLALSDSLHFQYCKFVRTSEEKRKAGKVDAPSELIGNALFNTALDQPVSALARLAERIKPYKGWADTYSGEDAGLIHWLSRQMGDARQGIDLEKLPARMTDADKAKLLLGYLADHPKTETPKQ